MTVRTILQTIRTLLAPPRLRWPLALPPIPSGITLRQYRPEDRAVCVAIYRENEPGRFPPGFLPDFEAFLELRDTLRLVLCEQDRAVAIGGVRRVPSLGTHQIWLLFGMVTPRLHGQGLGTALLAARLAALPEPHSTLDVTMSQVPASQGFYARFGFTCQGQMPTRLGTTTDWSAARLDARTWRYLRTQVQSLGLSLDGLEVPVANPWGKVITAEDESDRVPPP